MVFDSPASEASHAHLDQEKPSVSIALCTYNGALHIGALLESLAGQTYLPCELVVCDDRSTDNTLAIVAAFAEHAPFPVLVHQNETRLGYANNFLHAASLCSGVLVAFSDQDDIWLEKKLSACVACFEDPQVLLAAHTAEVWDGQVKTGRLYPNFPRTEVHPALTLNPFHSVPGFAIVLRRSLLGIRDNNERPRDIFTLGKSPQPMAHDQWVWFLATTLGKVATISEPLVLYRQHAANVVGAPKGSGWLHNLKLAANDFDYAGIARIEAEAAESATGITKSLFPAQEENRKRAVHAMKRRAQFHVDRSRIYDRRGGLITRFRAFTQILLSGGYGEDAALYRLGRRAAVKDIALGLTGVSKFNGDE